jgi:hypothetical protein
MLAKIIIVVCLLAIVYLLVSAFYHLVREKGEGTRTVWRLTWRIGLSMLLFLALYVAVLRGWLVPGAGNPVRYPPAASQPGDPWIPPVMAQIEGLARAAGVQDYTPPEFGQPPSIPGPTREQMEAAADMTPEERQDMIRGMVSGLMDRLANEGGPPEDWARLIGALGVLGDTDRARAISDEALQVFAGDTGALAMIRDARARAGLE